MYAYNFDPNRIKKRIVNILVQSVCINTFSNSYLMTFDINPCIKWLTLLIFNESDDFLHEDIILGVD